MSYKGTLADLNTADCVVVVGADLVANHQVAGFLVKRALSKGLKLVVVDGEDNPLKALADVALTPKKGMEAELLASIAGEIKAGAANESAAKRIAEAKQPVIVVGSARVQAAAEALAEVVNAKIVGAQGNANSAAAAAYKIDQAFETKGKQAVFLALGDEKPSPKLVQQVEGTPFVAVQAAYVSPATAMADVVFPVEMWAEQEGHYANLEGKLAGSPCRAEAARGGMAQRESAAGAGGQDGIRVGCRLAGGIVIGDWRLEIRD